MEYCCEVSRAWHVCEDAHSYSVVINSNPSEWVALCWGVGSVLLPRWHSTGSHMEPHKYSSSLAPHASNDDWHVLEDAAEFKWLLITARWQPFIVLQHIMMWFEYVPPNSSSGYFLLKVVVLRLELTWDSVLRALSLWMDPCCWHWWVCFESDLGSLPLPYPSVSHCGLTHHHGLSQG